MTEFEKPVRWRYEWPAYVYVSARSEEEARAAVSHAAVMASQDIVQFEVEFESDPTIEEEE